MTTPEVEGEKCPKCGEKPSFHIERIVDGKVSCYTVHHTGVDCFIEDLPTGGMRLFAFSDGWLREDKEPAHKGWLDPESADALYRRVNAADILNSNQRTELAQASATIARLEGERDAIADNLTVAKSQYDSLAFAYKKSSDSLTAAEQQATLATEQLAKSKPLFTDLGYVQNSNLIVLQCNGCSSQVRVIDSEYRAGKYDYRIIPTKD